MVRLVLAVSCIAAIGCTDDDGLNGEYELTEVLSNSCERQPTIGDTLALQESCGALSQLDPERACNDYTVDMFMRVDSFDENRGRKSDCSVPAEDGTFECNARQSDHGWQGHWNAETSVVTLYYAHGTRNTDALGHAGLTDITCEMALRYHYIGQPNYAIGLLFPSA